MAAARKSLETAMAVTGGTVRRQQFALCTLLLIGLLAFLALSWWLRVKQYIYGPEHLEALHNAGSQLFLPYIGIAFGGMFGAAKVTQPNEKGDWYIFALAAISILIWDLLAVGNVALILSGVQNVEDVLAFAERTMPLFSVLVAGSVSYYFGAQASQGRGNK